ncbi:transferrin-binding protein-like solute binding protein [Amphritea pacifica]|uniref:transferrin-binding protein-like solute binding protein n=1 Tax=Amphritea pacifica TaxID=2811233 RepID=UPI0019652FE3|nr:transferrin-binding protein-like solute binding protein [Amphritea pacifica]MBN1006996.1 transferrin-binding protein-like solute binding protein [Amphritea pacifica]
MNNSLKTTLLCCSLTLLVTGCGGGGGSSAVVKRSFTSFSAIPANSIVDIEGQSVEFSYVANTNPTSIIITGTSNPSTDPTAKSSLTYNDSGEISKLSIVTDKGTVSWDSATDTFDYSTSPLLTVNSPDFSEVGFTLLPLNIGWDYQTLGTWVTETTTGSGASGRLGSISVGSRTDGSAVPTTGTATFTGATSGFYIDSAGTLFYVLGNTSINADFANRSLAFTTSNNNTVNINTEVASVNSDLNLSGTLTYSAGSNNFSGSVTGTGLTGSASGYFYGPSAEEAGGTFALTGGGVEIYTGAFGAKR